MKSSKFSQRRKFTPAQVIVTYYFIAIAVSVVAMYLSESITNPV
ncbi:hypothetical protein [Psychrobacillus insolitus]|nr:hypothetical protein [Psychrobacillus insolitus]